MAGFFRPRKYQPAQPCHALAAPTNHAVGHGRGHRHHDCHVAGPDGFGNRTIARSNQSDGKRTLYLRAGTRCRRLRRQTRRCGDGFNSPAFCFQHGDHRRVSRFSGIGSTRVLAKGFGAPQSGVQYTSHRGVNNDFDSGHPYPVNPGPDDHSRRHVCLRSSRGLRFFLVQLGCHSLETRTAGCRVLDRSSDDPHGRRRLGHQSGRKTGRHLFRWNRNDHRHAGGNRGTTGMVHRGSHAHSFHRAAPGARLSRFRKPGGR